MPHRRAFKLYQRKRVVNINLNILASGFIAIAIAAYPVKWISAWVGPEHNLLNSVIAYALDTVLDVCVYYALHWIANHWNPQGHLPGHDQRPKHRRFIQDATRIQAERMALVPVFVLISIGGMWALQAHAAFAPKWAFVLAFASAMITTRVLHTLWGLRTGTFRDTVDFVIDDNIQIGRDLTAEALAEEEAMTRARAEETPDRVAP